MNVTMNDIKSLVGQKLGIREVNDVDRLIEDLGAQSADLLNIIVALEEKYGIEIAETMMPHLRTTADLYDAVLSSRRRS